MLDQLRNREETTVFSPNTQQQTTVAMGDTRTREQVMAFFKKASLQSNEQELSSNRNVAQDSSFRANLANMLSGHNITAKPVQSTTLPPIQMIAAGVSGKTTASNTIISGMSTTLQAQ